MSTIKPMNVETVNKMVESCKGVVTVEEHNVMGGLGSAIAEVISKSCKPIEFVGAKDCFGCSAHNYAELLEYQGLTVENIVKAVEAVLGQ